MSIFEEYGAFKINPFRKRGKYFLVRVSSLKRVDIGFTLIMHITHARNMRKKNICDKETSINELICFFTIVAALKENLSLSKKWLLL